MNSNKSEKNIRKEVAKTREKCLSYGIILGHDVVICKGPDRDVDRDAVNLLISFLMTGQYDIADKLNELGILSPKEYKKSTGANYRGGFSGAVKSMWSSATVKRILTNEMYLGHMVQGKQER
ncbi:MAG: recombinase family protein [Lachnospiraceae bacterium]